VTIDNYENGKTHPLTNDEKHVLANKMTGLMCSDDKKDSYMDFGDRLKEFTKSQFNLTEEEYDSHLKRIVQVRIEKKLLEKERQNGKYII